MLAGFPMPVPFDRSHPDTHPHLSFEFDPKGLDFSGWTKTFVHYNTKVCVADAENCLGTCSRRMVGNDDTFKMREKPYLIFNTKLNSTRWVRHSSVRSEFIPIFNDILYGSNFFTPIFYFLHQFFVFLHQFFVFFTQIVDFFYTNFFVFLHQFFAFVTPIFCLFYTNFFQKKMFSKF